MNLSFIIFRIVSGCFFLILGFVSADRSFSRSALLNVPYLIQTLAAFVSAVIGFYLVPFVTVRTYQTIVKWLTTLIQVTVQTTVARSMGHFFAEQANRIRVGRSRVEPIVGPIVEEDGIKLLVDTSAVIDGRIFDVARSGFLSGSLIVPTFVVSELQSLADSGDSLKRQRGRRGLNLLDEMRLEESISLSIWEGSVGGAGVDAKLIKLAKKIQAKIVTVDYNLNKAASLSGIKILNVNDLANLVKTVILPGEKIKIKLIHEGKEAGQGVGYLEDGTMIVVENVQGQIGSEIEVEVSRLLQTSAGKMIFAKSQQLVKLPQ